MRNRRLAPTLALTSLLLAAGAIALPDAPEWEIELLPSKAEWAVTNPNAINDHGWVAGYGGPDYATTRPVLWRDGTYVDLLEEFPGAEGYSYGLALDVNDEQWLGGAIVGDSGAVVAVLWDGRQDRAHIVHPDAADVPDYSFTDSQIFGLNDKTEAAGLLQNYPGAYESERAYVWGRYGSPGTLLPIPEGYEASHAIALNNGGVVGGSVVEVASSFRLEACAWIRGSPGSYELVHIHALLAAEDPAIVRSFVTCVDGRGRVYGIGQNSGFEGLWAFVWDKHDGLRFLDTDGSVGVVWGASKRALAGFRGDLFSSDVKALVWIREQPYVLPQLPDHDGHVGADANARGDVVGYAMFPGNVVWWQGSGAWIATRVGKSSDE